MALKNARTIAKKPETKKFVRLRIKKKCSPSWKIVSKAQETNLTSTFCNYETNCSNYYRHTIKYDASCEKGCEVYPARGATSFINLVIVFKFSFSFFFSKAEFLKNMEGAAVENKQSLIRNFERSRLIYFFSIHCHPNLLN